MEVGLTGLRGPRAVLSVFIIGEEHVQIRHQAPAAGIASDSILRRGIVPTDFVKVRSSQSVIMG